MKKKKAAKTRLGSGQGKDLVDFSDDNALPQVLNANVAGLEKLAEKLTETQKKILNVIISDFSDEPGVEAEKDVFKKLRSACARAGMLGTVSNQVDFFRVLSDPKFNSIVKTVGTGLVGMYIVPIMATQVRLALEGSQTAIDRLLEISGLKQSKYDFYLQRVALSKTDINVGGDLNFEGKTDAELKELAASFRDVPGA